MLRNLMATHDVIIGFSLNASSVQVHTESSPCNPRADSLRPHFTEAERLRLQAEVTDTSVAGPFYLPLHVSCTQFPSPHPHPVKLSLPPPPSALVSEPQWTGFIFVIFCLRHPTSLSSLLNIPLLRGSGLAAPPVPISVHHQLVLAMAPGPQESSQSCLLPTITHMRTSPPPGIMSP